ncbi:MAG: ArnT family glycosyltransferase [Chitinophagales bacterium]
MKWLDNIPVRLLIILLGLLLFIPFLGEAHLFDWDEINFAESAREMLETGNFFQVQIDYQPFTEKPPFFIWTQALSMKIFGVNEFAARLPNAIVGVLTLLTLFNIGKRLKDKAFGILWVLVYISCFLPHFYFKSGIIDPMFNLFIFLAIYYASTLSENEEFIDKKGRKKRRRKALIRAAFFVGLAVMTKGPVGLLLLIVTYIVFFIQSRFKRLNSFGEIMTFSVFFLLTVSVWYGVELYRNGFTFFVEFFDRHVDLMSTEDAGHGGPFYYHFIVLLIGCFPASVFMFGGIKKHHFSTGMLQNFQRWMLCLLGVVLIIFSLVQTKIAHYSSLAYFPITFFATYFFYFLLKKKRKWKWYHATLYLVIGILLGTAIALVPLLGFNIEALKEYINDDFAVANLNASVYWNNWEAIYGLAYIAALVLASIFFTTKQRRFGISILLVSTCIIIQMVSVMYVPRIEKYTQNAAIEFYQSKENEACYVGVLGFKSYAHLFYTKKSADLPYYSNEELLHEDIELPVYFVCKNIKEIEMLEKYPQLEKIGDKNGFVFLQKKEIKEE